MKLFTLFSPFFFLLAQATFALVPVPYSGKLAINGVNYFGEAQFSFSLHDGKGTTHWRNGNQAGDTIKVSVFNGRYTVLLGGQGMNPLPPELFLNHGELYLKVEFDNGEGKGLQHLGPDQLITATPRALVADLAKRAMLTDRVATGAVTRDMLSPEVLLDLNRTVTKSMLGSDVLADLNASLAASSVTRDKLAPDILADLNRTVTSSEIASNTITTAQLNEQILKYLRPEITRQPQSPGLIFSGQSISLNPQVQGKHLSYQWHRNGEPIAGATQAIFNITEFNDKVHDGNYTVVVSNDFGSVTSSFITLEVSQSVHTVASIGMEMIFCPPGTFTMGSPTSEVGRRGDEIPHSVTLTKGFYLGKYEVTQAQYQTVMNGNQNELSASPSYFEGNNHPVEQVSWEDAQVFLTRLNEIEQIAGRLPVGCKYVLPTEAEWEYACRAGTSTAYSWGNDINSSRANYNWDGGENDGNDSKQTVEVGQYAANPWGFFDMHGNVGEWVRDWKGGYLEGAQIDPERLTSFDGSRRIRGFSWRNDGADLRSASRSNIYPSMRYNSMGFRVGFHFTRDLIVDLNASVKLDMLWVKPGTFTMGSPITEAGRATDETEHQVTLTQGFYLGKYEVTQAQYEAVMTGNSDGLSATPSQWPNNPNRPVERVSWDDAQIFLTRLNAQQAANTAEGYAYVLPTEAEWEYACRAGTSTAYSWGNDINATHANWDHGNDANQTIDVGQYAANPWGFFDMHGNVWELVSDWKGNYPAGPLIDPKGLVSGLNRLPRGGSWYNPGSNLRSADRYTKPPTERNGGVGFRVGYKFIGRRTHSVALNSSIQLDMLWVEPGTFTMGSPTSEAGRGTNETQHNVTLTKGFYLGKYEVTQAQYEAVMTGNSDGLSATPSHWPNNPNRPVERVSWDDAQIFLTRLNAQQSTNIPAGWAYVLPTESQWEYACRAGTTTAYSWGDDINGTHANYSANGILQIRDVGQFSANPWGFFDMHGNVNEWTADRYQAAYPTGNPVVDPTGASGSYRVFRGGAWYFDGPALRSAKRDYIPPSHRHDVFGFRVGFQQQ